MTTALQTTKQTQLAEVPQFTAEQTKLIRDTIAKGASDEEFAVFLYRCKQMDLNPLKQPGVIHFIKYGTNPGTVVVGIEGIRKLAHRTGLVAKVERGVIRDEKGKVIGGWCEVRRKDWPEKVREEVSFNEYTTSRNLWATKPEAMIKKVAEATALRMVFPEDCGGVYEEAEFEQAKEEAEKKTAMAKSIGVDGALPKISPKEMYAEAVAAGEIQDDGEVQIPDGKHAKKRVCDIDPATLRDLVKAIEAKAQRLNRNPPASWQKVIDRAGPIIAAWENGTPSGDDSEEWPEE